MAIKTHLGGFLTPDHDPTVRARAENLLFEQRLSDDRITAYTDDCLTHVRDYDSWCRHHSDFIWHRVAQTSQPETFQPINAAAALPAAVWSSMGQNQQLIRVESLVHALKKLPSTHLDDIDRALTQYRQGKGDEAGNAKALLENLCQNLRADTKAISPRFAAFTDDLADDIAAADWPDRLRDRLGLGHFPTPFPVILMGYTIGEVLAATPSWASHPCAVPTQLDQDLNEIFHPSPRQEQYGRTLNLAGDPECDRKAAELLHLPFNYRPTNILKVGAITRPADVSSSKVAGLRQEHLFCLRYSSDPNFGQS